MDFARKTLSQVGHCMSCSEDLLGPPEVEPEVEGRLEGAGFDDEEGRLKREARSLTCVDTSFDFYSKYPVKQLSLRYSW